MAYVGFRNERVMAKATETLKPHLVGHHIYIYIYIYIYRERERERERLLEMEMRKKSIVT